MLWRPLNDMYVVARKFGQCNSFNALFPRLRKTLNCHMCMRVYGLIMCIRRDETAQCRFHLGFTTWKTTPAQFHHGETMLLSLLLRTNHVAAMTRYPSNITITITSRAMTKALGFDPSSLPTEAPPLTLRASWPLAAG